jgi:hypothetical protein
MISFLRKAFHGKFPGIKTIPITETDINNTLPQNKKLIRL